MKIYTRTGDTGETGLFGGARVAKTHPRVEAYGEVDELNSAIGLALALAGPAAPADLTAALRHIQDRLFDLGADLATPPDTAAGGWLTRVPPDWATELEAARLMVYRGAAAIPGRGPRSTPPGRRGRRPPLPSGGAAGRWRPACTWRGRSAGGRSGGCWRRGRRARTSARPW